MKFLLKEIIDLDYFLSLDVPRNGDTEERTASRDAVATRDREIYRNIKNTDTDSIDINDDTALLKAWLDHRRHTFVTDQTSRLTLSHHPEDKKPAIQLPGELFQTLYHWGLRAMALLGTLFGVLVAYSFLAYHGSRPVNVTLFITVFILFQSVMTLAAAIVLFRRIRSGNNPGFRYPLVLTLMVAVFMGKLRKLVETSENLPGGAHLKAAFKSEMPARFQSVAYKPLLFWPFFQASSLTALCFSLGCLGGTLFRVMVTDLAFGWQSTLFTSGAQVHEMVSVLALPWSWLISDALPSLAQVEGSRIILKQGITGLSAEHLAAWWPFLCMGILVYGILPRLLLGAAALYGQKRALEAFDVTRPRYRRLLMRMRAPRMDIKVQKTGGTRAPVRPPLPDPAQNLKPLPDVERSSPVPVAAPQPEITTSEEMVPAVPPGGDPESQTPIAADLPLPSQTDRQNTLALVLASPRSYPDGAMDEIASALDRQLGMDMTGPVRIGFDFESDAPVLTATQAPENGVVIILQEVWQPPIRGLLYYFTQLRRDIFPKHDIWIFLTQTPGEGEMTVSGDEIDFQVWQTAVAQLKDPGIIVERWIS